MKVANTRGIKNKIESSNDVELLNSMIQYMLAGPIALDQITFTDAYELESRVEKASQYMKSIGVDEFTKDEIMMSLMIDQIIDESAEMAKENEFTLMLLSEFTKDNEFVELLKNQIIEESAVFHKGYFDDNAYLKNIHIGDHCKIGEFELTRDSYAKYEMFIYDIPSDKYNGVMLPKIGTFDHRYRFPCIREKGSTWMSVTPNEIFTMRKPIEEAKGRVLTLGLGMGYYTYMVSEKEEVEHVTVIEKEKAVVDLFNTYILPQFANKDKITVIHADAFEYMEKLEDGVYDYCFADLWKNNGDSIPYFKLKKICKKFKSMKMSYWIEDALMEASVGLVSVLITEQYYKNNKIQPPEIEMPEDAEEKLEYLREFLKDVEIRNPAEIDYYLDYKNLIKYIS